MNTRSVVDVDRIVGRNLRHLRNLAKLSQEELGLRIGVTFQQIQKYEKGINRISAGKLVQVASALGCSLGNLFEGTDEGRPRQVTTYSAGALEAAALFDRVPQHQKTAVIRLLSGVVALSAPEGASHG